MPRKGDLAPKGIAQGVATLTAAGLGAAVGGIYGAASAATVDANNRQLHSSEKKLAKELAKKSGGKYTVEQIEEQMRLMGNKAFDDAANKTEVLTTPGAIAKNLEQDPNMPKVVDGTAVVEIPGQADPELQRYIIGNSNGADYIPGQSPYSGRLTFLGTVLVVVFGFLVAYLSIEFLPTKLIKILGLSIGLGIASVGGFSGRSTAIGTPPPFTNDPLGWRKAKKSYEQDSPPESDDSKER